MIRAFYTLLTSLILCTGLPSQNYWKSVDSDQASLKQNQERTIIPDAYSAFQLDFPSFKSYLEKAPNAKNFKAKKSFYLDIPMPDGSLQKFQVFESSVMQEGLQKKYPGIRSYKGVSTSEKSTNIRFDYGPKGFHGAIFSLEGSIYIDPMASNQTDYYISYYTKNHNRETGDLKLSCGTMNVDNPGSFPQDLSNSIKDEELNVKNFQGGDSVKMRVYKLALSCTGEWAQTQGGTVEEVLAAINTSVNRLNQVFENELSIRLVLVDRNDELIWLDGETDPWDNPLLGTTDSDNFPDQIGLREANVNIINGIIGSSNYDIGHCYTIGPCYSPGSATRFGLAGIAEFNAVCTDALKARGVTCYYSNDIDNITINVVAHEMGHQMDATHTFNNCNGSEITTPYEPGSGSTIMSYAGACGSNNVQSSADDYFHVANVQQIYSYMRNENGNTCPDIENTFNTEPSIELNFPDNFYIPISTPFELTGIATDLEEDELSYTWEQMDSGPVSNLGDPQETAPSFRSVKPSDSPTRYFPNIINLRGNTSNKNEVLPSYSRDFSFRFVVRDNHFLGGTTVWDEIDFKSTDEAGPFLITNHNSFEILTIGDPITLTWDVANTDGDLVNCQNVDIYLSTDDGYNFDHLLVKGTPNDGSYEFFVPNFPSFQIRYKVKASNNIFFDITDSNTRIKKPSEPTYIVDAVAESSIICLPDEAVVNFTTAGFAGFDDNISFDIVSELPEGTTYEFNKNEIEASETNQLFIKFPSTLKDQEIEVDVEILSGDSEPKTRKISFQLISNDFSDLLAIGPVSGSENIGSLPIFHWASAEAADSYQFELSTSPAFNESNTFITQNITDTVFTSPELLEKSTLYYWRVSGMNTCGVRVFGPIQTFHTEVQSCSSYGKDDLDIRITQSGTPTIEYDVNILDEGQVKDLNIEKLKGLHDQISDLKVSLLSPAGTEVILFENKCGNLTNYDLGFDDAAANDVRCPLTGGAIYKSKHPLSTFNEEEVSGEWTIRLDDQKPGNGGNLQVFTFEVCSNAIPDKPLLIKNNRLELNTGETEIISDQNITVEDPNNSSSELLFTLVTQVNAGDLRLDGIKLNVGDMFTQQDIYNGDLDYSHDNSDVEEDGFYFTVIDGEGGWIDQQWFEILIDNSSSTAVNDLEIANHHLRIFPNPASQTVNLIFETEKAEKMSIQLFDMQGKLILEKIGFSNNNSKLSLRHFSEGLYIVRVNTEKEFAIGKLVINR